MNISKFRNPYDYRNPVREAAAFAGRDWEVATIAYEIDQTAVDRASVCIVLHGPRAVGKTSLLYATERIAAARGLTTVRVELVEGDGEPIAFFRKLYDELISTIADEAVQAGANVPFDVSAVRRVMAGVNEAASVAPLQFPEAAALAGPEGRVPEAALRADLSHIVRLLGHPVVLLVDEAQLIAGDARALSVMRFLTTRVDGLVLVLSGTSGLIDRIMDVHSPILRQFKEIEVRAFVEHGDVASCIVRPLRSAGIYGGIPQGLASSLRQLTDGNPYEVQLYCHEMFTRWQSGVTDRMKLTPEVVEGIRSRMESGRDVLERPLVHAVRGMKRQELVAFNVLTSGLGHATPDEAWFAYCLAGQPEITREQYDEFREKLAAQGILAAEDIVRFAVQTELFDEVYARLWTARTIRLQPHAQVTSRGDVRAMLINRLFSVLHEFAQDSLHIFETCCSQMGARHVQKMLSALESMPDAGPDIFPRVAFLHSAILRTGEPLALDLTTVTCTYRNHTVERWLYSADNDDISLADTAAFKVVADRVAGLGGHLTADRVRVPLRTWPAHDWFRKASGELRTELADNHYNAAFNAYGTGNVSAARSNFQSSFALHPGWKQANSLTYLSLAYGLKGDALAWSQRALELSSDASQRALSRYNAAMANFLTGDRDGAAKHLLGAAAELRGTALINKMAFLLLPDPDDSTRLNQESQVDIAEAVQRARAALGMPPGDVPIGPSDEAPDEGAVNVHAQTATPFTAYSSQKPVVVSVATEWNSTHGGLSTFNRDLCQALAAAGAQVFCVVLEATAAEFAAADKVGVTLLPAPDMPGASDDMRLTSRPKQLGGTVPHLVLGHGRITGPAAQKLADDFFPTARRLHFVHMAPDEIEWYKPDRGNDLGLRAEERTSVERALGGTAHRVVTVGPRLHEQYVDEFRKPEGLSPLRLDPGFDGAGQGADLGPPQGSPCRVMLLGRVEDAELKGVDLAAAACGRVAIWLREDGLRSVRLVVRGAPASAVDEERRRIVTWAASPGLDVVVRAYTSSQPRIDEDLKTASLVIMPSRREGFGLVGLEAITQGIPVLISSESGLADLLRETLGHERASRFVVELSRDDEVDVEKWARAIERKLRDCEGAFRQAAELRDEMTQRVTWSRAAAVVLGEILDR
ncbi:D-inositol-3-phosphate glycosyltransferase [Streptomyces sp. ADI92-24]|uniref:glycosyltransferase n=1 Tax=Streptomyces sp. ADI92-24 TaxID=1522756 RepID=UPI000F557E79|nr:glycosyltransferase [Streptomyces sp. ADI92-24]RPK51181.1 D-inositol-3-phosphate glycosyltransferase [Streptomyces sp. ADI92-24]